MVHENEFKSWLLLFRPWCLLFLWDDPDPIRGVYCCSFELIDDCITWVVVGTDEYRF